MSRMVALGAVLGFALAVLALALFAKEPPKGEPPPPATPAPVLVQPSPFLRPVPIRKDLGPNGPMRAVLPPPARQLVMGLDAGT